MNRLLVGLLLAALGGCAGALGPQPYAGQAGGGGALRAPGFQTSWVSSDAKRKDLLYVSDLEAQSVFIYDYRGKGKLVGTLTGFFNPEGLCVDKKGDVFVTNDTSDGYHQIIEYAHGSTTPIQTLDNPNGRVNGCAVDPVTGNLAVTNFWGPTERAGGVSIYPNASGTPSSYTLSSMYYFYFCGYDDAGNLFVDGQSYGSAFGFAELPKGGSALSAVSLDQEIYLPGQVQWDGTYLAVGDQVAVKHNFNSVIYQFTISGSSGTEVNYTELPGANQVAQFWLPGVGIGGKKAQATTVIGPNGNGADTLVWPYPAAGSAKKTFSASEQDPIGATLSLAKR